MTGFGSALRDERERSGTTLEAISTQTKVTVRHLEALESEDFAALPGGVFRRGIVRAYLAALSLDDDAWMERFQASLDAFNQTSGTTPEPEAWETFAENVKRNRVPAPRRLDLRWFTLLAMLLALAAAAWAVWRYILIPRLQ